MNTEHHMARMGTPGDIVMTAHDPAEGDFGTDFLITWHADGSGQFSTREGRDWRWLRWSAPYYMPARNR